MSVDRNKNYTQRIIDLKRKKNHVKPKQNSQLLNIVKGTFSDNSSNKNDSFF